MVGVLIRMKLTVMRRTATGPRANPMLAGGVLGVAAAIATIAVATLEADRLATVLDLLAITFATWTMGWTLAPAYAGQPVLRPEQFSLLPIASGRLAVGLLGTAFVGVTTAITFVAFTALVVFAARLGPVPVLVSLPGLALQLALVVVLSRLAAWLLGALSRSRLGGTISAVITAAMLVVASSGWIVLVALDAVLATGFSPTFSTVLRALPSSWALVAVEASSQPDWPLAALALLGLAALVALLVLAWSRALGVQRLARPVVRGSAAGRAAPSARRRPAPSPLCSSRSGAAGCAIPSGCRAWWSRRSSPS